MHCSSTAENTGAGALDTSAGTTPSPPPVTEEEEEELSVTKSLHVRRDWYSTVATFVAGGVAGAASRTLTAPLDRIKLIVQEGHLVQPPSAAATSPAAAKAASTNRGVMPSRTVIAAARRQHPGLLQVAHMIKADGGWKAFWRGNVINCFKAGPEFAIVFSIRRYLSSLHEDCVEREKRRRKRSVARWNKEDARSAAISCREQEERESMRAVEGVRGEAIPPLILSSRGNTSSGVAPSTDGNVFHIQLTPEELAERELVISREVSIFTPPFNRLGCLSSAPHLAINCGVGAIAGLGAQGILYPMEVIKTRVVVSRSNEYTGGVRELVRVAYKRGGLAEFYRGFTPNMVGIVVYRGLEMGLYSSAQQSIMLYRMQVLKMNRHDASLSAAEVGLVGMFASTVAQTVSYPLNVIRTRLQTQGTNGRERKYTGMVDCCVKMIRNKGVTSLFSGLTANYLKAVPASACTFMVFESVQRMLVDDN